MLESIELEGCGIGERGAVGLASSLGVGGNSTVLHVDLTGNEVGGMGAQELINALARNAALAIKLDGEGSTMPLGNWLAYDSLGGLDEDTREYLEIVCRAWVNTCSSPRPARWAAGPLGRLGCRGLVGCCVWHVAAAGARCVYVRGTLLPSRAAAAASRLA